MRRLPLKSRVLLPLLVLSGFQCDAFSPATKWTAPPRRLASLASSPPSPAAAPAAPAAAPPSSASSREELKAELFERIAAFNALQSSMGKEEVDFGVSGGELDKDSRAPRNLADSWYARSPELGAAGDAVFAAIRSLEAVNPTADPTQFLGTAEGRRCPLHGAWQLKFTTAADASFSSNSTRGDAKASNVVDGVKGTITNVIDFQGPAVSLAAEGGEEGGEAQAKKPPVLEQLRVKIVATAASPTKVRLRFKSVRARVTKLFGLPLFGKRVTLVLPVPGPTLTRFLFFFSRKERPEAFFNVLYLDDDLRIHETGEGNFFVQERPVWGKSV